VTYPENCRPDDRFNWIGDFDGSSDGPEPTRAEFVASFSDTDRALSGRATAICGCRTDSVNRVRRMREGCEVNMALVWDPIPADCPE
jgi:hypothetical protein